MTVTVNIGEAKARFPNSSPRSKPAKRSSSPAATNPSRGSRRSPTRRGAPPSWSDASGARRRNPQESHARRNSGLASRGASILMAFIVDASFAAGWLLPDEKSDIADALARRLQIGSRSRARSVLARDAQPARHRATAKPDPTKRRLYFSRPPRGDPAPQRRPERRRDVARLALKHGLSAYDAAYLDLALREHSPLATLDKKLAAAAHAEGVTVLGPLGAS